MLILLYEWAVAEAAVAATIRWPGPTALAPISPPSPSATRPHETVARLEHAVDLAVDLAVENEIPLHTLQ